MRPKKIIILLKKSYQSLTKKEKTTSFFLFFLTLISTTITAFFMSEHIDKSLSLALLDGFSFSLPLMLILTVHELGHYLNAFAYGVKTTPPYFIPMPVISPIGTMGAFIKMQGKIPDKRALFDIAFWGPAMSFLFSVPFFIIGLLLSEVKEMSLPQESYLFFGDSLLTWFLSWLLMTPPEGSEILIHPMGFAGWTGLLVTAINMLPVGQLDGGHIAFSLLGKRQKQFAYLIISIIVLFSLYYSGWILWILIFLIMGVSHPPLQAFYSSSETSDKFSEYYSNLELDSRRKKWGYISFVIFVLIFIPAPIYQSNENDFSPLPLPDFFEHEEQDWNVYLENQINSLEKTCSHVSGRRIIVKLPSSFNKTSGNNRRPL